MKTFIHLVIFICSGSLCIASDTSEKVQRVTDEIEVLSTQVRTFKIISARLPTAEEGLSVLLERPENVDDWKQLMRTLPLDPWGRAYIYRLDPTSKFGFTVSSNGPDESSLADDIVWPPMKTEQGAAVNP